MSTRHAVISAVAWITVFTASTAWAEAPVLFVDPKLKSAVEEALGVLDPTPADMGSWPVVTVESDEGLSFTGRGFACTFGGIEDLTGLEYARDMEVLNLDHNQIKDLTPLAGVTGLRVLILSDNNGIEDLGPLSGLGPQLFHVNLHRSGIQDVGPLSGLTGLRWLSLRVNSIEDVGPLGGLSGLESLILRENQIEDVGPLSGLTGLEELDLRLNPLNRDAYCHGLQEIEDRNPPAFEGHIAYDPSMEPPIGVWASDGLYGDRVRVTWEGLCGGPNYTYRYQVYRSASVSGPKAVISGWQLETSLDDLGAEAGTTYWYWVRADLYGDGTQATDYSLPDEGGLSSSGPPPRMVLAVDAGAQGGPFQDGSPEHPFATIQGAIDAAAEGATVRVCPGLYLEDIDLLGKRIQVIGTEPNDPNCSPYPVICGQGEEAVVRFTRGEDPNCKLAGFVITHGPGPCSGVIQCRASSPQISHCLIAGNRVTDPQGSVVTCMDSQAVFHHCTIADNHAGTEGAALVLVDSPVALSHCILWDNSPAGIRVRRGTDPLIRYSDVEGGWLGPGPGNLNRPPLFARGGSWMDDSHQDWMQGDYHLQSCAGRWDSTAQRWLADAVTSPCVDAGDPTRPVGAEPEPNGHRVNLGAYGGTTQASLSGAAPAEDPVFVEFKDPALKSAVEEALGVLDPTPADMGSWPVVTVESDEGLSFTGRGFACTFGGIEDLTGLEYARDMEVLNLDHNKIKDLTPLAGVTGLRVLILSDNNGIEDLGPLSGLGPQLFHLNLHRSGIQDVGPLSGLTGLRWLSLRVNSIEDVGPLGGLSGLESLILRENQVEDVGPLSGLTGLEELDLRLNPLNRDAYCHGLQEIEDRNPPAFEGHIAYDPSMEPPIGVWASDGLYGDRVRVTWEGLCGGPNYTYRYQVYRSASVSGPKAVISGWQLETSLDDLGAEAGTTYWYWVRADLYGDGTQATDYSLPDEGSR